jgi:murein DD-endopeptidase MepM/ murein hydrolase activator NlpD
MKSFNKKSRIPFAKATDSPVTAKILETTQIVGDKFKRQVLLRTYWGRGSSYKKILHVSVLLVTSFFLLSGITSRLGEIRSSTLIAAESNLLGNVDTLQQGLGIITVESQDSLTFKISEYTVKDGDSIDSVISQFGVNKDTLKWANSSKIDYYSEKLTVGDKLLIPEINGVLYEVQNGDTIDSVVSKTNGNKFEVVEINQLYGSDTLVSGSRILVPNGTLPPPPPPPPVVPFENIYRSPTNEGVNVAYDLNYSKLNDIQFLNPLSNPDCAGYGFSRGYSPWHNGTDLPKAGGCPIRAAASGQVTYSGWAEGSGYTVTIYHGNGVKTSYFHGETIWVRNGQYVEAGQDIMYMGCTGFCTGTHLHLSLRIDENWIDPAPYIPY